MPKEGQRQDDCAVYLLDKCCTNPLHITNKGEEGYERAKRDILEEMASWMASMADMRRLKNVTIYNPMVPLGLLDDEEHILRLWGSDPVHPTDEAYEAIAEHLRDTIVSTVAEQKMKSASEPDGKLLPPPLPSRPPNPSGGNRGFPALSRWPKDRLLRLTLHGNMPPLAVRAAAAPGKEASAAAAVAAAAAEAADSAAAAAAGCVAATSRIPQPPPTTAALY